MGASTALVLGRPLRSPQNPCTEPEPRSSTGVGPKKRHGIGASAAPPAAERQSVRHGTGGIGEHAVDGGDCRPQPERDTMYGISCRMNLTEDSSPAPANVASNESHAAVAIASA